MPIPFLNRKMHSNVAITNPKTMTPKSQFVEFIISITSMVLAGNNIDDLIINETHKSAPKNATIIMFIIIPKI